MQWLSDHDRGFIPRCNLLQVFVPSQDPICYWIYKELCYPSSQRWTGHSYYGDNIGWSFSLSWTDAYFIKKYHTSFDFYVTMYWTSKHVSKGFCRAFYVLSLILLKHALKFQIWAFQTLFFMKLAIRRGVEPNNFGALGFITLVKDMAMKKNDKNNFPVNCMHFSPPGGIFAFPFFLIFLWEFCGVYFASLYQCHHIQVQTFCPTTLLT